MPVEAKPLFRPDVLRPLVAIWPWTQPGEELAQRLRQWVITLASPAGDQIREKELLPSFFNDIFRDLLGYSDRVSRPQHWSFSMEKHVKVDGKFADGVLGDFRPGSERFVVAIEGKGPRDPLERPFAGRKMSAVDQAYRYAINLPCDWIVVTSMREIRLYHKGSDQHTYERFLLNDLAASETALKKFVYLLGAARVVPEAGVCHLPGLLVASERVGRELTNEFYLRYAILREQAFSLLCQSNATLPPEPILRATQKLLDRIVFCCFAEDRGLLPPDTIRRAFEYKDPYRPGPIFETFRALFQSIHVGNSSLDIPGYNGGLFAHDAVLDTLVVPDAVCTFFKELSDYDYRPGHIVGNDAKTTEARFVDVDLLGHIFEQSLTDLERIQKEIAGKVKPPSSADSISRRKREGAYYTPPFVTRYLVSQTLGKVLEDRFEILRKRHQERVEGTAVRALEDPAAYDPADLNKPQRLALTGFWMSWQGELRTIRVLDPACGSGAFLIEAFDQLHAAYLRCNDRLKELQGQAGLFDLDREILQNNLFGVDLNDEAIQIARLSLWIKTAERDKKLTSLDRTLRVGNSLVDDPAFDARAFDWRAGFQNILAAGGFDVVVGNPPYVRQEWISHLKPYLEPHYRVYHGMADLYVYFYELGLRVLKPGGRLGYVVTNKWLKAGYGEPLRAFLATESRVESVVDFGHAKQIFPDADVFPGLLVTRKPEAGEGPAPCRVCIVPREQLRVEDLSQQIATTGFEVPADRLGSAPWSLEPPAVAMLVEKLHRVGVPLKQFANASPLRGILTGLNEAFLVDGATKESLVAADARSAEVLRPYVRGQDIDRWRPSWAGLWMIALKSSGDHPWPWATAGEQAEAVFAQTYPALHRHLNPFREALIRRQDQGRFWWELRSCAYWGRFDQPKFFYQDISWQPQMCCDTAGTLANNTVYFLPSSDLWILAVLNSPIGWWFAWRNAQHGKDEALRFFTEFVEDFPIPNPAPGQRTEAESAVQNLMRFQDQVHSQHRALFDWLKVQVELEKLSQKLQDPGRLTEDEFVTEVRRVRGTSRPLTPALLQALREAYKSCVQPLRLLAEESIRQETRIHEAVNQAYQLTPEEVALLWATAPPRMPLPSA